MRFLAESITLLLTGWSRYWDEPEQFINLASDGLMHTPGFGNEAARFLMGEPRSVRYRDRYARRRPRGGGRD